MSPESLREWEERLGPDKVQRAISIVRSYGWEPGSTPPNYVWAEVYAMVDGVIPERFGSPLLSHKLKQSSTPSISESILGFKLF